MVHHFTMLQELVNIWINCLQDGGLQEEELFYRSINKQKFVLVSQHLLENLWQRILMNVVKSSQKFLKIYGKGLTMYYCIEIEGNIFNIYSYFSFKHLNMFL